MDSNIRRFKLTNNVQTSELIKVFVCNLPDDQSGEYVRAEVADKFAGEILRHTAISMSDGWWRVNPGIEQDAADYLIARGWAERHPELPDRFRYVESGGK